MESAAFREAFTCELSGGLFTDPVIVIKVGRTPSIEVGSSYERSALVQWLNVHGDVETVYVPNVALRRLMQSRNLLQILQRGGDDVPIGLLNEDEQRE